MERIPKHESIIIDPKFQKEIDEFEKSNLSPKERKQQEQEEQAEERKRIRQAEYRRKQEEIENQKKIEEEKQNIKLMDQIFDAIRDNNFWSEKELENDSLISRIEDRFENTNLTLWNEISKMVKAVGEANGLTDEMIENITNLMDQELLESSDDGGNNMYNTYSAGDKGHFTLDEETIVEYETDEYDIPDSCKFKPDAFAKKMKELVEKNKGV